jgi:hypothetical protein
MSDDKRNVKVKAVLMWAFLSKANDMSEKFQVELTNLSEQAVDRLEGIGLSVHVNPEKPEKGFYITCKSAKPIKAFDSDGDEIPPAVLIGNGSKATVVVSGYDWTYKGKKGRSASIRKLIVTDLIEYSGGDLNDEEAV